MVFKKEDFYPCEICGRKTHNNLVMDIPCSICDDNTVECCIYCVNSNHPLLEACYVCEQMADDLLYQEQLEKLEAAKKKRRKKK